VERKEGKTMNKSILIGNLTKNPELRTTTAGVNVCGFTVAVNRPKTANNPDPGADYFNVNAWRGLGDTCAKYLEKGRKVCVTGRVSLRTWEKDGKHGASLEVLAEDVEFLSSRTETATPAEPAPQAEMTPVEPDDLPF
jgi:single-strand DNA-binding protein